MIKPDFRRRLPAIFLALLLVILNFETTALASPWSKKKTYGGTTSGKLFFGLNHSLFSWVLMFTESREPQYQKQWQGFSVGIGKTVVYTAAGLIQLATFPIPVDFPDIGLGIHIPNKECPGRHDPNYVPPTPKKPSKPGPADTAPLKIAASPLTLAPPQTESEPEPSEPAVLEEKPAEQPLEPVVVEAKTPEPEPAPPAVKKNPGELSYEETIAAQTAETGIPRPAEESEETEAVLEENAGEEQGSSELDEIDKEMDAFFEKEAAKTSAKS